MARDYETNLTIIENNARIAELEKALRDVMMFREASIRGLVVSLDESEIHQRAWKLLAEVK
jgi:hypothetical protein